MSPAEHQRRRELILPPPAPATDFDEVDELVADIQPARQRRRSETNRVLSILDQIAAEGGGK
jgi:hypothetical protein